MLRKATILLLTLGLFVSVASGAMNSSGRDTRGPVRVPAIEDTWDNHNNWAGLMTVTDMGNFGFMGGTDGAPGDGFEWPAGSDRLYEGSLVIGTAETQLSEVARNENQTFELDFVTITPLIETSSGATQTYEAIFDDSNSDAPDGPMEIQVHQTTYSFADAPDNNYVLIALEITNMGTNTISGMVVGYFIDWDLASDYANYGDVTTFVHGDEGILSEAGYIYDTGLGNWTGMVPVSDNNYYAERTLHNPSEVYPPRMTDADLWLYLNESNPYYGPPDPEDDVGQMVSLVDRSGGESDLAPGDTATFGFAVVSAGSEGDFIATTNAAIDMWEALGYERTVVGSPNTVSVYGPDVGAEPGWGGQVVTIELSNTEDVGGAQFTLDDTPDYLYFVDCEAVGRAAAEGFTADCNETEDGVIGILVSLGGDSILPGDGPVIEMIYDVDSSAVPGDVDLEWVDFILSDPSANPLEVAAINGIFTIIPPPPHELAAGVADGGRGTIDNFLPVFLDNPEPVAGIEFFLCDWPDWLSFGDGWTVGRAEAEGFEVFFIEDPSNDFIHVLVANLSGGTIPIGAGPILELNVGVDPWAERGEMVDVEFCGYELISDSLGRPVLGEVLTSDGSFDISNAPPQAGGLTWPPDTAPFTFVEGEDVVVTFRWDESYDIDEDPMFYVLQLSLDPDFTSWVDSPPQIGTELTVTVPGGWVPPGGGSVDIYWRVMSLDNPPSPYTFERAWSDHRMITVNIEVGVEGENAVPTEFALKQNYPNPFNPETEIKYDLPKDADVSLVVYDMLGHKVKTLIDGNQTAGYKSVSWNATNDMGRPVGSGVYVYRIVAGDYVNTNKMILIR